MTPARVLTLASSSPRRRQLLEMLGIPLVVAPSHIPELRRPGEEPDAYVTRLAGEKAAGVRGEYVLGADTTVVLDHHVLEKPADAEDAVRMLMLLQGNAHEVMTAIALVAGGRTYTRIDVTRVIFRPCSEDFVRGYVETGEPMDKAGAYGIQGYGAALIERVEGDFFSVMGLPLRLVLEVMGEAGWEYRFGRKDGRTERRKGGTAERQ